MYEENIKIIINIIKDNDYFIKNYKGEITENTNFYTDLNFDSLDKLDFIIKVEEKFNIYIKDKYISKAFESGTVKGFINFINNLIKNNEN